MTTAFQMSNPPAATEMPASGPAPRPLRLAMLLPTLLLSVAVPIAIFKGLQAAGVTPVWALAAGCIPPVLNNLRAWLRAGRLDPIGILTMASIAGGPAAALINGTLASRIATDCVLGAAWGLAFLGSALLMARPALFYVIRSLVAGDDASRIAAWNGLWRYAAFRRTLRLLTATCGAFYLAGVLIELALTQALSIDTVVTTGPIINLVATLVLVSLIRLRMRAMRRRLEREEGLTWPL
jgi:hypothetical protein